MAARLSIADARKVGIDLASHASPLTAFQALFVSGGPFSRPSDKGITLKNEDLVSAQFYDLIWHALSERRFIGLCSHVANEMGERTGFAAMKRTMKKKRLGMVSGSPDWWFIWTTFGDLGAGVIELKRPGVREGGLSQAQVAVRDWCREIGIPWACHNKAQDAFQQLVDWRAARHFDLVRNGPSSS